MSDKKHTSGPWRVDFVSSDTVVHSDGSEGGPYVICSCNIRKSDWRGNVKLLAAAPDLLEALEKLLDAQEYLEFGQGYSGEFWSVACEEALAAIAKAKGEKLTK